MSEKDRLSKIVLVPHIVTFTITTRKGILRFQKKKKKPKDIPVFQMK